MFLSFKALSHCLQIFFRSLPLSNPNGKRRRSAKWIIPRQTYFSKCVNCGEFARRTLAAASCNAHISCHRLRQRLHSGCNIKMRAPGLTSNYMYMYIKCSALCGSSTTFKGDGYCAYTMSWPRFTRFLRLLGGGDVDILSVILLAWAWRGCHSHLQHPNSRFTSSFSCFIYPGIVRINRISNIRYYWYRYTGSSQRFLWSRGVFAFIKLLVYRLKVNTFSP